MAERSLRGMKIGTHSLETDEGVAFVERHDEAYRCANGHNFTVTFSIDAEAPLTWECKCGAQAELVSAPHKNSDKDEKPQRTHWDMLLERRSIDELQQLLDERLALLRSGKLHKHYLR